MIEIGLGTVQLGLPYGSRRNDELMSVDQANQILASACANHIRFFDTAMAYGEAESRLGNFFHDHSYSCELSSKLPAVSEDVWSNPQTYWQFVSNSVAESLRRLKLERFKLLQFHQCDLDFLSSPLVHQVMSRLLEQHYCEQIGVSVYDPRQAEFALEIPAVSALQIPVNLVDRRFLSPQLLAGYRKKNLRLIARSVFLQGILTDATPLPPVTQAMALREFKRRAREIAASALLQQLALSFAFGNQREVLSIGLIGVDSAANLEENISSIKQHCAPLSATILDKFSALGEEIDDRGLLSPANW